MRIKESKKNLAMNKLNLNKNFNYDILRNSVKTSAINLSKLRPCDL